MALDASFSSLKGLGESFSDAENHLDISLGDDKFISSWNATGHPQNSEKRHNTGTCGSDELDRSKRGRPRADIINTLIVQGSRKEDGIRCKICSRIFPREKSLQAHMRTHTGEKPYKCDYPDCGKSFCQSGQLKTHQRLHTGVKPFVCTVPGCESRFTHANRHCSEHPTAGLVREDTPVGYLELIGEDTKPDIVEWLRKQANAHQKASNSHKPSRPTKRCLSQEIEKQWIVHKKRKSESECEGVKGAMPLMDTSLTAVASLAQIADSKEGLHNISNSSDSLPLCNSLVKEESTGENVSTLSQPDTDPCTYALNSQNSSTSSSLTLLQPVSFPMTPSVQFHQSLQPPKDLDKTCDTVTVPTVGLRQTSVIKHTIQVRKDHQLPIQRLLKPEEYEAIMNSPKKQAPLSPARGGPRRIPFSPIKESINLNENTPFKSKAQIALFASPEQLKRNASQRSSSPVQNFYCSPLAMHNLGTPIRSRSPKKFSIGLTHSTPIRSSPRKHMCSPAPTKQTPCRSSPSKYHLYTTPSPVAHRINSPRKAHLFVCRIGGSPVKRASPVNLFASPPTKKVCSSPKRHFSPQKRCSPRKVPFSQKRNSPVDLTIFGKNTPENPEKLMGALALIKLAGGL